MNDGLEQSTKSLQQYVHIIMKRQIL